MVAGDNRPFNIPSEFPIAPVRVLDVLDRLALMDGVEDWSLADDGTVTLHVRPRSRFEMIIRRWEPGADELAIDLGSIGLTFEAVTLVRISRGA